MILRIGNFILLVGLVLLLLFLITTQTQNQNTDFLIASIPMIIFGLLLRRKFKKPPTPTGRFRTLRKIMNKPEGLENQEEDINLD